MARRTRHLEKVHSAFFCLILINNYSILCIEASQLSLLLGETKEIEEKPIKRRGRRGSKNVAADTMDVDQDGDFHNGNHEEDEDNESEMEKDEMEIERSGKGRMSAEEERRMLEDEQEIDIELLLKQRQEMIERERKEKSDALRKSMSVENEDDDGEDEDDEEEEIEEGEVNDTTGMTEAAKIAQAFQPTGHTLKVRNIVDFYILYLIPELFERLHLCIGHKGKDAGAVLAQAQPARVSARSARLAGLNKFC